VAGTRCIICGREAPFPPLFERDGFQLVRCAGCGLVFQDPPPSEDVLAGAYYHDEEFARALVGELRPLTRENARRRLRLLGRAGGLRSGMSVLDVGAASGAWLEVAAANGAEAAVGVEIGAAAAAGARARGLDVRTGKLADALSGLEGERFDLITFWDVLEHLRDPRHELSLARELLAPGGRIAATFPNVEGLYPQLTHRLLARRTGIWEYPELPVHIYDFSPTTARRLFEQAGYTVERLRTFATPYGFYRTTSLSPRRTGTGARAALLRAAFDALHLVAYPIARPIDRGNSIFAVAAHPADSRG
jgi:SAM-dependent methyltransferase